MILREGFDYLLSKLDPFGAHIDPPSVAIYETLVVKGADGKPYPGLATSWTISEDKLTWTFHVREGARFHSGDVCNAHAIVTAFLQLRWGFYSGHQLWYWDPVDTIYAADDSTVVFTLHYPYVRLPSLLWGTHTAICNEARRAADPDGSGTTFADGTGPYRLVSYTPERVEVEKWLDYPDHLTPRELGGGRTSATVDRIIWTAMLDPRDRVTALERGDVHCIHGPEYEEVERLEVDPRFRVTTFSQASNAYLALNWKRTELEFDRLEIRQAISLGIDRDALVRDAVLGYGTPTIGPIAAGGEFYDPTVEDQREFAISRAADVFDAAGWMVDADGVRSKGGQRLSFECVIQDDTIHRRIAEGLRGQLARVGVELTLRPVLGFQQFYDAVTDGPASFINKWLWQDPVDAAIGFTATWGMPRPNWQSATIPALDNEIKGWLAAETDEELQAAASAVQKVAAEHLPYIPLLTPKDVWVNAKSVSGWEPALPILYPLYHGVAIDE